MYNNAHYSPPVNNLLQPDIYNRLDAEAIERTRVMNTQLDQRLRVQQRLITKYRLAAERFHRREKDRVKNELSRINLRLPATSRIPDFRNKFLYGTRPREGLQDLDVDVTQSMPEVRVRKIRGVPEERPNLPFCERFFIHHLPTKKKFYRDPTTPPPPVYVEEGSGGEGAPVEAGAVVGEAGATGAEGAGGPTAAGEAGDTSAAPSGQPAATLDDVVVNVDSHDANVAGSANRTTDSRRLPGTGDATSVANEQQRNSATKLAENQQTSSRRHDNIINNEDDDFVSRNEKGSATVRTGRRGRPHSINGRQSPRKPLGYVPSDSVSLPPLRQQNKKLARSSPQLYHG